MTDPETRLAEAAKQCELAADQLPTQIQTDTARAAAAIIHNLRLSSERVREEDSGDLVADGGHDVALDDDWSPSCWDCGHEFDRRDLNPHPVHVEHDDEPGYERIDVLLCRRCRRSRMPTHECPDCGEEWLDVSAAAECCQHRNSRLIPDGGQDVALDRIADALERQEEHQRRQADAVEVVAEQTAIQNAVLFEVATMLDRRNSIELTGVPDEALQPKARAIGIQDWVLYLAENVDVDEARRWADD